MRGRIQPGQVTRSSQRPTYRDKPPLALTIRVSIGGTQRRTWREPTWTRGQHANSTQKSVKPKALTTAPPERCRLCMSILLAFIWLNQFKIHRIKGKAQKPVLKAGVNDSKYRHKLSVNLKKTKKKNSEQLCEEHVSAYERGLNPRGTQMFEYFSKANSYTTSFILQSCTLTFVCRSFLASHLHTWRNLPHCFYLSLQSVAIKHKPTIPLSIKTSVYITCTAMLTFTSRFCSVLFLFKTTQEILSNFITSSSRQSQFYNFYPNKQA